MKRLIQAILLTTFILTAVMASLTALWLVRQQRTTTAPPPPLHCAGTIPLAGEPLIGEPVAGRIVWFFDRPLKPVAAADARDLLIITPALAGRVSAQGTNLIFQLEDNPAPNTIYHVEMTDRVRAADGAPVEKASRQFLFPTFRFEVDRVWLIERTPERTVCAMRLPVAVNAADLRAALTVLDNQGRSIDAALAPGEDERTFLITLPGQTSAPLRFVVAAGLPDASGRLRLETTQRIAYDPASPEDAVAENEQSRHLYIQWADFDAQGREGLALNLSLNWRVSAAEINSRLTITPEVPNRRIESRYNSYFTVYGEWASNTSYQITLEPGIRSQRGDVSDKPIRQALRTRRAPAWLGFADEGQMFFPRRPDAALALESRNATEARVRIARLFPSNLPVALQDIRRGNIRAHFSAAWCEELREITVPLPPGRDRLHSTVLPLDQLVPLDDPGVYFVHAAVTSDDTAGGERYWGSQDEDAKIVLSTNIGALAHWTPDELLLYAHDLRSLDPLTSATATIYSGKNQPLAGGLIGPDGLAHWRNFESRLGEPKVVVIESGGDFTFLDLTPRPEDSEGMSSAWPRYSSQNYEGFVYADRDLIRPGEMIHLRWIVSQAEGSAAAGVPLLFRVLKPDGRPMLSEPVTLSDLGTGGRDVATLKAHPTGAYRAQLLVPGDDAPIGEYTFSVEEFVPNRLKAEVELAAATWTPGGKQRITVRGAHLTGAPAEGRKASAVVRLDPAAGFAFEGWPGFRFGNDEPPRPETIPLGESQLKAGGQTVFDFEPSAATSERARWTAPVKATVIGRVFELGGRAVAAKSEAMLFPSDISLGVSAAPAPERGVVDVEAAAVASDSRAAALDEVEVTLERKIWRYHLRRYHSHDEPAWMDDYEAVETRRLPLRDGRARAAFAVENWGHYRVRVHSPRTPQYSTQSFYSSNGVCQIADASRPALLRLTLDEESVAIGSEARVRLEAPFDGKVLIVLQNGSLHESRLVELRDQRAEITLPIRAEHRPVVWIEATLIHGLDREHGRAFPFSSFAKAMLRIEDSARRLNVELAGLPEEIAPERPAQFELVLRDAAGRPIEGEITLAAVDEGIHALTNYANPDPWAWLRRARRPDLRRSHYYDRVAFDFAKPLPGGDGPDGAGRKGDLGGDVANRLAADAATWNEPVALWSGVVRTDADGHATLTLPIPDYTGRLRLVAVAAGANGAMGAASGGVFVRRPFDLEIALPRFLLPGDTAQPVVQLRNSTEQPAHATLSWRIGGALAEAAAERTLELAPRANAALTVALEAGAIAGQGRIHWTAAIHNAAGESIYTIERDTPLPVHHPFTFESRPFFRALQPGEEAAVSADDFLAAPDPEIHLTAGANPLLRLRGALQSLAGYPYGCVEQTTSRLMPMFVLRRHEELTRTALGPDAPPLREYLQAGIDRLFALQTRSGGLGAWPGVNAASPYGSIYALHFLVLAQNDPALRIPAEHLDALKQYVKSVAMDWSGTDQERVYQRAYATFVLALDGDLDAIRQIDRFEHLTLPRPARLLLAAALAAQSPDSQRVKLFLSGPAFPYKVTVPDAALASDVRNKAVELLALNRLPDTSAETMAALAMELTDWLERERYGSTQEQAFVATALAEYLGRLAAAGEARALILTGDQQEDLTGPQLFERRQSGSGGPITIRNTGAATLFLSATISGLPRATDTASLAAGMELRRAVYDERGREHASPVFDHGRSYIVALTLTCPESRRDLLVVDRLPAGFEIENTRLDPALAPEAGLPAPAEPWMLELRDDRVIVAFEQLGAGTHHYAYVVRAVTPGLFAHPPAQAECMYQPAIRARTGDGGIEIRRDAEIFGPPVAEN